MLGKIMSIFSISILLFSLNLSALQLTLGVTLSIPLTTVRAIDLTIFGPTLTTIGASEGNKALESSLEQLVENENTENNFIYKKLKGTFADDEIFAWAEYTLDRLYSQEELEN